MGVVSRSQEDGNDVSTERPPGNHTVSLPQSQGIHLITSGTWAGKYLITVPADGEKVIPIGQADSMDKAAEVHDLVAIGLYGKQAELNFPAAKYKMESFIEILLSLQKLFPSNKFWVAFKNALEAGLKLHPGSPSGITDMNTASESHTQHKNWPVSKPGKHSWASMFSDTKTRDSRRSPIPQASLDAQRDNADVNTLQPHSNSGENGSPGRATVKTRSIEKAKSEPVSGAKPLEDLSFHSAPATNTCNAPIPQDEHFSIICRKSGRKEEAQSSYKNQSGPLETSAGVCGGETWGAKMIKSNSSDQIHQQVECRKEAEQPSARGEASTAERDVEHNVEDVSNDLDTETDDDSPQAVGELSGTPVSRYSNPKAKSSASDENAQFSGYKGVGDINGGLLYASIHWEGHPLHIGQFSSQKEAAMAYDCVSLGLFGLDADINYPPSHYTQQQVQQAVMDLKNRTGQIHRKDVANAVRNAEAAGVPSSPPHGEVSQHRQTSASQIPECARIAMGGKTRTGRAIKRPMRYRDSPVQMSDTEESPTPTRDSDQPRPKKSQRRPVPPPFKTVMSTAHTEMTPMNRPPPMMPLGPVMFPPMYPMMPVMGGVPMPFGFPGMRPPMGPPGIPFPPPFMPGFKYPSHHPKRQ